MRILHFLLSFVPTLHNVFMQYCWSLTVNVNSKALPLPCCVKLHAFGTYSRQATRQREYHQYLGTLYYICNIHPLCPLAGHRETSHHSDA